MASSSSSASASLSTRGRVLKIIDDIATANQLCERAGVRFSSACRGCGSASPHDLHASSACGHAVCGACASGKSECPECKKRTRFVKLVVNEDRTCCICLSNTPRFLDVFNGCGHAICSGCCKQMRIGASRTLSTVLACPLCRIESAPFSLVEEAQGVPQGAFPSVERASELFDAVEKTGRSSALQRLSFASRIEKGSIGAQNAEVLNYYRQRNAQLRRQQPTTN